MRCRSAVRVAGGSLAALQAVALVNCAPRASPDGTRTLQVLVTEVPRALDPYEDQRLSSLQVYANVFEPLVRVGPASALAPALAETWHSPSTEDTVFRLRSGIRFHDGTLLDAGTVVASFERARRSSKVSGHFGEVSDVHEIDAHSLSIRTRTPVAVLVLGLTAVFVTRPGGPGLVGTGPYRVESFEPGESVRLVRYRDYAGPPAYLDEVVFRRYGGDEHALRLMREQPRTLLAPASDALAAHARTDSRVRVVSRPTSFIHYLAFGFHAHAAEPLRDRRVRRAVRLALDLPSLIRSASPGGGQPASQLAPPGTIGYDGSLQVPARDVAQARALLAAAGHPQGVDLDLDVRAKDGVLARAVAAQLAEAGIRLQVHVRGVEEFARRIDGTSPLYLYNWIVGQEAGAALRNFFHTRDPARTLGLQNRIGYSNPELDALLERSGDPVSTAERVALQQQAMSLLMDDLPWVPLFIPHERTIQPADLEIPTRLDEMLVLADVRPVQGSPSP